MKSLQSFAPVWSKLSASIKPLKFTIQITAVFLIFAFSSLGQDLDDFKSAASGDGIDAIPYSDLERKASGLQSSKNTAEKAAAGYKGRKLYESKKNSLRIKKEMTEDLEEAREKLEDYDGESSSTENSLKAKVKDLEEELEDVTEEIQEMDKKINEGLTKKQALLDIRFDIDQVYAEVRKRLSNSKSYPHKHIDKPSSSDEEAMEQYDKDVVLLKDYIDDIDDTIEDGRDDHKQAITDIVKSIEWLEDAKDLR